MRWWILLMALALILAGCGSGGDDSEEDIDPFALLGEAATNIRAAETFRLDVRQSGAEYNIFILLDGEEQEVAFRRAIAQYVSPDRVQGTVRVIAGGVLPVDVDIFSYGFDQWVRFVGTNWIDEDFAPGFNPQTLIAEDTGFQAALAALTELDYEGIETLEDGTSVYHIAGIAEGDAVTSLLVGMIEAEGLVPVDVYIDRENRLPVRLIITQLETITEDEDDPTTWTIDVYDVGDEPELTPPDDAQ